MTNNIRVETEKLQLASDICKLMEACYKADLGPAEACKVAKEYYKDVDDSFFESAMNEALDMAEANPGWGLN